MTRKEETTKVAVDSFHSPNNVGFGYIAGFEDGVEWSDKTMLDNAIKFFQSKSKHGMINENINVFIDGFCKIIKGE